MEYTDFDECLQYIEDCMIKYRPFDALLDFSQGAVLPGALPALHEKVPKVKFIIIIGGGKLRYPPAAEKGYSTPISCLSLHFLGEIDFLRKYSAELLESCVQPMVTHHPKGHTIPRLDEASLTSMMSFIERINKDA